MEPTPLDRETIGYLRRGGGEMMFPADEVIIRRGDPGDAVYLILEGQVEVRLRAADGRHLSLATLGPGEMFGELSVLRGAPASADVRTIGKVTAVHYPAALFPTAMTECAPLREHLLANMADRMHKSTADAWGLYKKAEGFTNLARPEVEDDAMVAASARMRSVKKKLVAWGGAGEHVAVAGEPGTGRELAARLVHKSAGFKSDTQVKIDCRELKPTHAHASLFGVSMSNDFQEGSGCFGALHLAHGGTLLISNLDHLAPAEQVFLAGYIRERRESNRELFPDVLVIVTVRSLDSDGAPEGLIPELVDELPNVVKLPNLANRPKEILPLARRFLEDLGEGGEVPRLSQSAEHALVGLHYSRGNVEELRHVIELAARCCDGDVIRADHIFAGLGEDEAFGKALGQPEGIMRFVRGRGLELARAAVLLSFLVSIAVSLIAPTTGAAGLANTFVWAGWEPVVFGLFLLAGALWCTVCPLSFAGTLAKGLKCFNLPPPAWLTKRGERWIPAVAFVGILLVERVFHMTEAPAATAIMLLTLILGAVVFSVIFEREVWCRYVCPLGRLAVVLAPAAPLSMAADRKRCASTCTTHECYKGTAETEGCPVFHHPLMTSEAHHCKLCGECLTNCPHGSTGLYLRPPLKGTWRLGGTGSYPTDFAYVLLLATPLFLAVRNGGRLADPSVLTAATLLVLIIGFLAAGILPRLFDRKLEADRDVRLRVAAVLAILAWGPLMADQFANIPILSTIQLSAGETGSSFTLLTIVQVGTILSAAVMAVVAIWRVIVRSRREGHEIAPLTRLTLPVIFPAYVAIALVIVL
jgi:transcriptional regulator with AAA-type ATPase domain/polyferredoxin